MWQARGRDSKGEVALACDGLGSARLGWRWSRLALGRPGGDAYEEERSR
jgi:hypothetical protein